MATPALIKRLLGVWNYYWFRPAPLIDLAFCRLIMAASQGLFLVRWNYLWLLHERAARPDSLYNPLIALRFLSLPFGSSRPSIGVIEAVYWATIVASITAAVGLWTRLSLAVLAAGSMFIHAYIYSLGKLHHPEALMMIALPLLALGPSGRALSMDRLIARLRRVGSTDDAVEDEHPKSSLARWPVLTIRWIVAMVYLSAAIHKLSVGGADWMNGYTLRYYLLSDGLERGNDLAVWLSGHHGLAWLMSWATILFEGTFFLVLVRPTLAWLFLPLGIGLHIGIAATSMADPFLIYLPVYAVFIPWHAVLRSVRTFLAGRQLNIQQHVERSKEPAAGDDRRFKTYPDPNKGAGPQRLAERVRFGIASFIILSVLVLQASATHRPSCMSMVSLLSLPFKFRYFCPPGLWPFIDYPMYSKAYHEGDRIDQVVLVGVLADSSEVQLSPEEVGLGPWIYPQNIDSKHIIERVEYYNAARGVGLIRLRVESKPLLLRRDGIHSGTSRVLLEAEIGRFE